MSDADPVTPAPKGNRRATTWVVALLGLALILVWAGPPLWAEIRELWATIGTPERFRDWVDGFGPLAPLIYLGIQALQVILVPIPGAVFPPVGALAFGPWPALLLSVAGMGLGSAVVFLLARRFGRPVADRLVPPEVMERYERVMSTGGGLWMWLVFILPLFPDDALCAMAGLSRISFRRFMVMATLGRVPSVAAGVFTVSSLEGAPLWLWLSVGAVLLIGLLVGYRYRDRIEARLSRSGRSGDPAEEKESEGRPG